MQPQQSLNYERIARAIRFIREHRREQPRLEEVAEHVHMSVYHFQRTFREWAGTSPKQFLQYLNVEHAKRVLQETHTSLADTAEEVGLSGTGRLHDLFVRIEGMTPGEWKNGGEHLDIRYSLAESPFGEVLVASTDKGICWLEFADENGESLARLRKKFPHARYTQARDERQQAVLSIFTRNWDNLEEIKLHLKGTDFQLQVWQALLRIPLGGLATYGHIAAHIGHPTACRAVGTAVGDNPVAYLIPCHRVIRATGEWGPYRWGETRKTALIGWEAARREQGQGQLG